MKDNATSAVKIKYYSKCLGNDRKETYKCEGLKVGDVVTFTAEILVTSCPENRTEWLQTIHLYPVGLSEGLLVDLEMLCSCPCESPDDKSFEQISNKCESHGTYTCGICECDKNHFGRKCECSMYVQSTFGGYKYSY